MLSVAKETDSNGARSIVASHDVGLATENLLLQAIAMGLVAHPMGGFDRVEARRRFAIPEDFAPLAMIALGYPGDPATLDEKNREREAEPRVRKALGEIAFAGRWETPFVP